MSRVEDEATWNRIEEIYTALQTALMCSAPCDVNKETYILGIFRFLDHLLDDPLQRFDSHAFTLVGDLLRTAPYTDEVWAWLRKAAMNANDNRRVALTTMLTVPLSEKPIKWEGDSKELRSLVHFFNCWHDPNLKWIVEEAYEDRPEDLHADIVRCVEECERRSMSAPVL